MSNKPPVHRGQTFEKFVLKIVHRHIQEVDLRNPSQFDFRARHKTTLQCTNLTNHVTLNYNNTVPMAVVFLNIEKAFCTNGTWFVVQVI
jgi:hypothetical protein